MTAKFTDLSLEILDRILLALDPLDIARISQISRFFHEIVYGALDQQFWRGLYLAQPLDDPRRTVTHLGRPRPEGDVIDWKGELQRIMRARTVVQQPSVCRGQEERRRVLQTCIDLVTCVLPISSADGVGAASRNVRWLQEHLKDGVFLERDVWEKEAGAAGSESEAGRLSEEEEEMLARLHALCGLTARDMDPARRRASQAFVYSQRHRTAARAYGPFLPSLNPGPDPAGDPDPDGATDLGVGKRVDWAFVQRLVHEFGMLLLDAEGWDEEDAEWCSSYVCPLGAEFAQSIIPKGVDLDREDDWAGMEGLWVVRYGFMDHRELLLYNDPSIPKHEPQDTSIFEGADESLASLDIYFQVTSTEPDPLHPTRPKINVVGEVDGKFNLVGFVKLTDDDQVWWHFSAGNDDKMVWSCHGIGLGGVRSRCGYVGVWSTVFHDVEDPIGPFWMQRELFVEEDE